MSHTRANPLSLLVKLWKDEDAEVDAVDCIVPLSYTTLPHTLTRGTKESVLLAAHYAHLFPDATVVASDSAHTGFPHCTDVEYRFKKELFGSIPHIRAGAQTNSITEAEAIHAALGYEPKHILVICGEIHARSVRWIWRRIFPNTTISIRCMPYQAEYQKDHPFFIERYAWPWFFAGIARYFLLLIFGLKLRHLQHHAGVRS